MADGSENACPICCEQLSSSVIGAVVPCGHCFHQQCFVRWQESQRRSYRDVRCPTCNTESQHFCRIFLDLRQMEPDDASVSSEESGDDIEEEEVAQSSSTSEPVDSSTSKSSNDGDEVIVLDDDEDDQPPKSATKRPRKSIEDDNKYRKRAKLLKKRVKMLEAHRQQQSEEQHQLLVKHEKVRVELAAKIYEVQSLELNFEEQEMELQGANLERCQLRRERDELKGLLVAAKSDKADAERALQQCKDTYKQQLERANAKNMREVQTMLSEYPKLTEQRRQLKDQLRFALDTISELKRRNAFSTEAVKKPAAVNREKDSKKRRHALSTARQLQDCVEQAERTKKSEDAKQQRKQESWKSLNGKVSAHAARFSRGSEKPLARPSGLAALERIDASQPIQSAEQADAIGKLFGAPRKLSKGPQSQLHRPKQPLGPSNRHVHRNR